MKKRFILTGLALILIAFQFMAQTRTVAEAMSIADSFLSEPGMLRSYPSGKQDALLLVYTAKSNLAATSQKEYFYVFNRGENKGFIIVAADVRAKEVLGYSEEGTFDYDNLPPNFKSWLAFYEHELDLLDQPNALTLSEPISNEEQQITTRSFPASVSPFIKTKWNQEAPYNIFCPNRYTGCVATAMAQIMYYYKYPARGTGSHSYTSKTNNYTLSADFGATTYNYATMRETYTGSETEAQKNAVATLMFHCGVATDMDYKDDASAAYDTIVPIAMVKYFGYDPQIELCVRQYYSLNRWMELLKTELSSARPVYYSGNGGEGKSGHAFLLDGYDNRDLFHVNWGWGGSYQDTYFSLSALNPTNTRNYSSNHWMGIGIKPSTGSSSSLPRLKFETMIPSKNPGSSFLVSDTFTITVNRIANISSITSFTGIVNLGLYNASNDNFIQNIGTPYERSEPLLPRWNVSWRRWANLSVSSLSPGTYKIRPVYSHSSQPSNRIIMESMTDISCIYLTISGGQATLSNDPPSTAKTLTVSATSLSFASGGEQKSFTITSNTTWTVSSNATWATVSPSSGSNNGTVNITATANTGTAQRTATITINGTGATSRTVSITQAAPTTTSDFKVVNNVLVEYTGRGGAVAIPSNLGITSIGEKAFYENTSITSVTIPGGVTAIGDEAFFRCANLASVTFPTTLKTIGANVFIGCALTTASIPASVTSIGLAAFGYCDKLTTITVISGNTVYSSDGGVLYNNTKSTLLTCPAGKSGAFAIPASVTSIGRAAFWGCRKLTSVTIHDKVTTIRDQAFGYCTFTSVKIPASVTTIEAKAFTNCTELKEVSVEWSRPPVVPLDIFNETNVSSATLRVPRGTLLLYRMNAVWMQFRTFAEYDAVPNEAIETPTLKAFASDGIVHITGIQPGQPLRIYNLTGQLVYSDIAKSSEEQIPLTMRGVYVVVAGDQTMKISVF